MNERRVLMLLAVLAVAVGAALPGLGVVGDQAPPASADPADAGPDLSLAQLSAAEGEVPRRVPRLQDGDGGRGPAHDAKPAAMPLAVMVPTLDAAALDGAVTWAGRVVDGDGAPVAGAAIELVQRLATERDPQVAWLERLAVRAVTDGDGYYQLARVPAAGALRVDVWVGGLRVADQQLDGRDPLHLLVTRLDGRGELRVAATPAPEPAVDGTALHGRLLDEQGRARDGWWVAVVAAAPGGRFAGTRFRCPPQRCGAHGEFGFTALPPGRWRLEAWHPRNQSVARGELVHVGDGEVVVEVAAATVQLPARLVGRVCDDAGVPVAAARVGLVRATGFAVAGPLGLLPSTIALTDADGCFAIDTGGVPALALGVAALGVEATRVALGDEVLAAGAALQVVAPRCVWLRAAAPVEARFAGGGALVAIDATGHLVPITPGDLSLPSPRVAVDAPAVVLPRRACALTWQRDGRELGRLQLRGRDEPEQWRAIAPEPVAPRR